MSRNFASPHSDRECLYAPLRRTDELPGHVKTEALAELHNATFWNSQPAALERLAIDRSEQFCVHRDSRKPSRIIVMLTPDGD